MTQFVEMQFKGIRSPGPLGEYSVLEIEHILPNTPEAELRESFSKVTGKNYEDYKIRLGNLTLLEKPINIVASNSFFEKKTTEYRESANYLTRSITGLSTVGKNSSINRINQKLLAFNQWAAGDIERRHNAHHTGEGYLEDHAH